MAWQSWVDGPRWRSCELEHELVDVTPEPVLAGLVGANDRVARRECGVTRAVPASCRNSRRDRTSGRRAGAPSPDGRPPDSPGSPTTRGTRRESSRDGCTSRRLLLVRQRDAGEQDAGVDGKLAEDVPEMKVDGVPGEEHARRDLLVGETLGHERGDGALGLGQAVPPANRA